MQTDDAASVVGNSGIPTAQTACRTTYIGYAFNVALILYPFLSRASFAIFKCRDVDGTLYLEADYTIQCEDAEWYWVAAGSTVLCLVYVLGLPMYVARDVRRGSNAICFYAEGYRTDRGRLALGWEVLEMLRKFLLTSLVLFLHQGSVAQVAVALVVSVCFLVLHVRVLPFASNADNWLQGAALVALCIVYFVGLIIKALPESDVGSSFDSLLQVSATAIFVVAFSIPLCLKAKFWYRSIGKSRDQLVLQDAGVGGHARNSGLSNTLLSPEDLQPSEEGGGGGCGGRGGGEGGYELLRDEDNDCSQRLRTELRVVTDWLRREKEERKHEQGERKREQEERKREQEERKREQEERKREQEEHVAALEERVAMQEELGRERQARAAVQEERYIERAAMQEQLRLAADLAAATPPLQGAEPGAAAAAVTIAPGRGFFDTQHSAGVRAADPKALVGKTIEVDGNMGAVKAVVGKAGGSTLHTVEFGSGKVENIHLAKRAGGKGTKFHIAADE